MNWKFKLVMIGFSIMNLIISLLAFDAGLLVIKGFLFTEILLVASYFDIKTRIIPDWIHVLIILVGFIEFDPIKSIVGLIFVPMPYLIMAMIKEGSFGGGDVKLMMGIGFLLGVNGGVFSGMVGLLIIIFSSLLNIERHASYPFVPGIFVGVCIYLVIIMIK